MERAPSLFFWSSFLTFFFPRQTGGRFRWLTRSHSQWPRLHGFFFFKYLGAGATAAEMAE